MVAPAFRAAGLGPTNTSTSTAIPKPAGTAAGDVLYALVTNGGAASAPSGVPSGWELTIGTVIATGWAGVYELVAGGSEPTSYTWTGFVDSCAGSMIAISGADSTTPTHQAHATVTLDSSAPADSGVTTTVPECLIVGGIGIGDNTNVNTWAATDPATLTERAEVQSNAGTDTTSALATGPQTSTGPTGTLTVTLAGSRNSAVFTIAVQPPQAAGPTELGAATEADAAQTLARVKSRTAGPVTETGAALQFTGTKQRTFQAAAETGLAQPLDATKTRALSPSDETGATQAFTRAKARVLSAAAETGAGQPLHRTKAGTLGTATGSSTAQPLARTKRRDLDPADETGTALALADAGEPPSLGTADEAGQALSLARAKVLMLGTATETGTVPALGRAKALALTPAAETGQAQPLTAPAGPATLGVATEAGTAAPFTGRKVRALGGATETADAVEFVRTKTRTVSPAGDTATAGALTRRKARTVGAATESDTARGLGGADEVIDELPDLRAAVATTGELSGTATRTASPTATLAHAGRLTATVQ